MRLFKTVKDLQTYLDVQRKNGLSIGFAPTMGALHAGHISLIALNNKENDISVASIFVNPTQFNEISDLDKYPRTEGADIEKLTKANCDVLFMPDVADVYPKNLDTQVAFDFGGLATVMEGEKRPGHFDGVAQVVKRLLDIIQPDSLYMGQKDYQQFAIIQEMLVLLKSKIRIVSCPIVREKDGLAMSSRNLRLTKDHRERAVFLSQLLESASSKMQNYSPKEIEEWAMAEMTKQKDFKPEYFQISDGRTLQEIERFEDTPSVVACLACWVGEVRLIDNKILK